MSDGCDGRKYEKISQTDLDKIYCNCYKQQSGISHKLCEVIATHSVRVNTSSTMERLDDDVMAAMTKNQRRNYFRSRAKARKMVTVKCARDHIIERHLPDVSIGEYAGMVQTVWKVADCPECRKATTTTCAAGHTFSDTQYAVLNGVAVCPECTAMVEAAEVARAQQATKAKRDAALRKRDALIDRAKHVFNEKSHTRLTLHNVYYYNLKTQTTQCASFYANVHSVWVNYEHERINRDGLPWMNIYIRASILRRNDVPLEQMRKLAPGDDEYMSLVCSPDVTFYLGDGSVIFTSLQARNRRNNDIILGGRCTRKCSALCSRHRLRDPVDAYVADASEDDTIYMHDGMFGYHY
jgi:hypothetical protein